MIDGNLTETVNLIREENESVVRSFRQTANDNNNTLSYFAKDLWSSMRGQNNNMSTTAAIQGLSDEVELSSRRIGDTNQILMNSINIQNEIVQQLGILNNEIISMGDHIVEELKKGHEKNGHGDDTIKNGLSLAGEIALVRTAFASLLPLLSEVVVPLGLVALTSYGVYDVLKKIGLMGNNIITPEDEIQDNIKRENFWNWLIGKKKSQEDNVHPISPAGNVPPNGGGSGGDGGNKGGNGSNNNLTPNPNFKGKTNATKGLEKNEQEAYNAARAEGLSDSSARALVANMMGESLAGPHNFHIEHTASGRDQEARGIVQWDKPRSDAIKAQFGKYPNEMSVSEQTKAAIWEMKNNPRFKPTWDALNNDKLSADEKITPLVHNYEASLNQQSDIYKSRKN